MGGSANLAAAIALYERVIDISMVVLGADRLETLSAQQKKAPALVGTDRFGTAVTT
jgi:isopentenyl diphosphate isomerase/L-lactate dehydrogenase-like FMN-dependent dehydrogenase